MFDSYKKKALAAYEQRDAEGTLSPRLKTPTPAGLRDECYDVYEEKGRPKEDATLRLFFGPIGKDDDYSQRIRNFDIDRFRPLVTFLNNTTVNTRDKNTRLLLWLLELERKPLTIPIQGNEPGRPQIPMIILPHQDANGDEFNKDPEIRSEPDPEMESPRVEFVSVENNVEYGGMEIITPENSQEEDEGQQDGEEKDEVDISKEEGEDKRDDEGKDKGKTSLEGGEDSKDDGGNNNGGNSQGESEETKPPVSVLFKVTCSIIILFVASTSYWFWKNNADKTIRQPLASEHCMYWAGQHYEPINCDNNDLGKLKIPLNNEQLENQQRITMPDTLTNYAIGKVWYGKVNGSPDKTPQFYTDSGTNPLDTTKRLLPLTSYMLNKYVSYERHLLNTSVWIVSSLVLFSLLITLAYRTRPGVKSDK